MTIYDSPIQDQPEMGSIIKPTRPRQSGNGKFLQNTAREALSNSKDAQMKFFADEHEPNTAVLFTGSKPLEASSVCGIAFEGLGTCS